MSTQPEQVPEVDLGPPESIRQLVNGLVRTAAPKLGKTAVARIALPLTDALIAVRGELREQADVETEAWRIVGGRLGAADPADPQSVLAAVAEWDRQGNDHAEALKRRGDDATHYVTKIARALGVEMGANEMHIAAGRERIAEAALKALDELQRRAPAPIEVGEVITTVDRLALVPVDAVVRDSTRDVCLRAAEGWVSTTGFDEANGDAVVVSLPARVLDLGASA